jgi:sugar phosphate isomerase/epimerase
VPMVTTDITDPDRFPTRKTLDACARSGVSLVRLGYWTYDGGARYDELLARARRDLDQLDALAAEYRLKLAVQLHGGTLHTSGATTRALLAGHNPERIGAYPDPGNQAVQDGRDDWRLTFDLLSKWLCCVGVKNGVADGMVPWADIIAHLVRVDFAGILSFHSHYEAPYAQVLDQTRTDLRYVRRLITGSSA